MITYELRLSIGIYNAEQRDTITVKEMGYSDEEWDKLSQDAKDNELEEVWADWKNNYIDGGWEEV